MLFNRWLMCLVMALGLVACGGGGGNARAPATPASGAAAVTIGALAFSLDKTSITNSGLDKALLTVTALDASRNVVKGVPMFVTLDSGSYSPLVSLTNDLGQASGYISIGDSKANRTINATYTLAGISGTASVNVVGSSITISALPTVPAPGSSILLTLKALDTNGTIIPNIDIGLTGTLTTPQTVNTGVTGTATATITAPASPNSYSVVASALGVTQTKWVAVTSGVTNVATVTTPMANIAASLSITPNTILTNLSGATTNRATLRAAFFTNNNVPVSNIRTRFEIDANSLLGNGEAISTDVNTIYTDASGYASSEYISGMRTSPTNGVVIRVCYGPDDASIASGACPNSISSNLTVIGQPLSISIGTNNLLDTGNSQLTYIKYFDVAIADAAGLAISNALVSASVDITQYGKGVFSNAYQYLQNVTNPPDRNADQYLIPVLSNPPNNLANGYRIWCPNEDINRNGILDVGEDTNGDGALTPRKAEIILSYPGTNKTDDFGRLRIKVEYAQNVAGWLAYTIKVSTSVMGSEGSASKAFITTYLDADKDTGSFLLPPYGTGACDARQ